MEWRAVDHVALLSQRISTGKANLAAKVAERDEHLRLMAETGREIERIETKLAAWAELEEDYRRAAEEEGELHLLNATYNPPRAAHGSSERREGLPVEYVPPKKRKRGTKAKVIAFYEPLKGEPFSIDDAVHALHVEDPEISRDTIGSILSTLRGDGILDTAGFGRYRQLRAALPSSSVLSAPGINHDRAEDYMDELFADDDAGGGGGPDD